MSDIVTGISDPYPNEGIYGTSFSTSPIESNYVLHLGNPKDVAFHHVSSRQIMMCIREKSSEEVGNSKIEVPVPSFLNDFCSSLFNYYRCDQNEKICRVVDTDDEDINWEVSIKRLLESCVGVICRWILSGCPENIIGDYGSLDLYGCESDAKLNVFLSYLLVRVVRSCFNYDCMDDLHNCFDDPVMRGLIAKIWESWSKNYGEREGGNDLDHGVEYLIEDFKVSFSDLDEIITNVLNGSTS